MFILWRRARAAQWNGLQNRKAGGSNPPVSSIFYSDTFTRRIKLNYQTFLLKLMIRSYERSL